jgi:hypothetical protein
VLAVDRTLVLLELVVLAVAVLVRRVLATRQMEL